MKNNNWKSKIQEITEWSDIIMNSLSSCEEAEIYISAGLKERIVAGRHALVQPHIDEIRELYCYRDGGNGWHKRCDPPSKYEAWKDWTNADLMGEGYPPYDENGDPYELHHIGQTQNSPFAELTWGQHMGNGNNTTLHPKRESEIDRTAFEAEKSAHWRARSDY